MALSRKRDFSMLRLHGFILILYGIIAVFIWGISLYALVIYFGVTFFLAGLILALTAGVLNKRISNWGFMLLEGLTGIILGMAVLLRPSVSLNIFAAIAGIFATVAGLFFLAAHFNERFAAYKRGSLLIMALISLIFGIVMLAVSFEAVRVVAMVTGVFAIIYGIFSLINTGARLS